MDKEHTMFSKGWLDSAASSIGKAIVKGELKPFPNKSKRQPKKLVERKRIINAMEVIYHRNKRQSKKESDDEVFDEASHQVIKHEAQALANKKRSSIQDWFDKNKARLYRIIIFLVEWLMGSLITAIIIMPFSVSAGSNFMLLTIFGLIEAMACTAFYREYTIQKKYHKLDRHVQHQCSYFHRQVQNAIQQQKEH